VSNIAQLANRSVGKIAILRYIGYFFRLRKPQPGTDLGKVSMPITVVLAVGLDSSLLTAQNSLWKPAGYVVTPAGSIREAIERFKAVDFDLVLLGHSIPIEHRERLAFLIRASGSRIPVICVADPDYDPQSFADATLKNDASALLTGMEELLANKARMWAAQTVSHRDAN
jgi:hypothetical protein